MKRKNLLFFKKIKSTNTMIFMYFKLFFNDATKEKFTSNGGLM